MVDPAVAEAAGWLAGQVVRTPVIRCDALDELAGARLWLKAENLQRGGSFKFRGALRAVGRAAAAGVPGVITQSSGNHGIAVAMAARELGIPATVVLPFAAPQVKVQRIKECGAEVVRAQPTVEECRATVEELRAASGYAFIDVRGDLDVIAGQATASLELIEQASEIDGGLDAIIVPSASGCGVAGATLAARGTDIAVYAAEPAACGAMSESLHAGHRVTVEPAGSVADALLAQRPGRVPFDLIKDSLAGAVTVTEREIVRAFALTLFHTKLLVEPGGVVGVAAAIGVELKGRHRDIGIVLTGGNVGPEQTGRLIDHA